MPAETTTATKTGQLHTALATWVFLLGDAGHQPDDAAVAAALKALREAPGDSDADALGQTLVDAIATSMGPDQDMAAVTGWLSGIYGSDRINTELGQDREARTHAARRHQFASNLPWLARIIDRFPGGELGAHWLLVERVDEQVTCMDPYPWDDLDEEYSQPLVEFMVKWELAGCEGVRFTP